MYYSKKYWNLIIYIYKLKKIKLSQIQSLNTETKCYRPYIFKNINLIIVYDGKQNNSLNISSYNFLIKKLI